MTNLEKLGRDLFSALSNFGNYWDIQVAEKYEEDFEATITFKPTKIEFTFPVQTDDSGNTFMAYSDACWEPITERSLFIYMAFELLQRGGQSEKRSVH